MKGTKILVCGAERPPLEQLVRLVCKDLSGVVPAEIQVIPAGFHHTPKGDFLCDEESAASVIAAFEGEANDMGMDYEHQTLEEPPVEAPASGWIKKLINKGTDGIWASVEWTEKARQYIANKEYRYVSPVFLKRVSDNKVVKLFNVALTNKPNIDGMVPLINKGIGTGLVPAVITTKEASMKKIFAALGLSEDTTEDQGVIAINALKGKADAGTTVVANKAVLTALGLDDSATESAIVGTIMASKQATTVIETLTTQVNKLTDQLKTKEEGDVVTMVNKAISDGKVTPAQKDWALEYAKKDLEGFKVFVAKAPAVVVTGAVTGAEVPSGEQAVMDATQTQVNKMMGIDAETHKKFGVKAVGVGAALALLICLFCGFLDQPAFAALSSERSTVSRSGEVFELGVATGVKIYKGALVAVNSSGYATPGATATTLVGLGRADATVDNTLGQNGDLNIRISRGIFRFSNSANADAIANDDIGKICYIVDDATVALTNGGGTRSEAGRIFGIDSSGVWVEFLHFSHPGTVVSADIVDGTIVAADIASDAVTTAKILNANVTTAKIADANVTTAKLAPTTFTIVTDNTVLTSADCGKIIGIGTDAKTITLPSTVAGCKFKVVNTGASGNNIVEIVPAAADKILGETRIANGTRLTIAGADAEHLLNTKATAVRGDYVILEGDGVDGWYINGSAGIWAEATP